MLTEKAEFDEIYQTYKNLVLKVAYTYSGNYSVAEDITQTTFLQLYRYFDDMNHANIRAWLYTTAKNCALNYTKRLKGEELTEDIADDLMVHEVIESAESEFLNEWQEEERCVLHERIFAALMQKNRRWYDAIVYTYYHEIPQIRVAEMMGMRVEVLHSLLHRAKEWIKKEFNVEYEELNDI
jgi:RNA polymerase sigma-70 factor (ECF subfamily)